MNPPEDTELSKTLKYLSWGLIVLLAFTHEVPYLVDYRMPNWDLYKVMHVLTYLMEPELFAGDRLSEFLVFTHTTTAPGYYYGLSYLSYLVTPKGAILTTGFLLTVASGFFAGGRWKNRKSLLVSGLVLLVLLHIFLAPIEGNRRSFSAVFLLALFWIEDHPGYNKQLFLVTISAAVYPPISLLILAFYALKESTILIEDQISMKSIKTAAGRLTGLLSVFLVALIPYLFQLVFPSERYEITNFVYSLEYDLSTITGFLKTFLAGSRQALFRDPIHTDLFLAMVCLILLEKLFLRKQFKFRKRYGLLLVTSLILWALAHLTHPLIYQPFKYTRMSLILITLLPVGENLPQFTKKLTSDLSVPVVLRFTIYGFIGGVAGIYTVYVLSPSSFPFLKNVPIVGETWWKFLIVLPAFLGILLELSQIMDTFWTSFLGGVLLVGLTVLPHAPREDPLPGVDVSQFEGLYSYLQQTEPGTIVAGPPGEIMDPIPTFGKRGVFATANMSSMTLVCERTKKIAEIYLQSSAKAIENFMHKNNIDYLLVDRNTVRNQILSGQRAECLKGTNFSQNPYLDRNFPGAVWSLGKRFYLIETESLQFR